MSTMPMGDGARKYDEVCMLVECYAKKLASEKMSYADLLQNIDRLTQLGAEARKLWGER